MTLFACRIKFHKFIDIDNLDEWPGVKVSKFLAIDVEYIV